MPAETLARLLAAHDALLTDGLPDRGPAGLALDRGAPAALAAPARIRAVAKVAVDAGADLIRTNSAGANAARLRPFGAQSRAGALSRAAAEIAQEAAERSERRVVVAGAIGPTGEIFAPMGTLRHALAVEIFHEQAEALRDGGASVLWLGGFAALEELAAAAEAARLAGLGWCGTMRFDSAGRTLMGLAPAPFAAQAGVLAPQPEALGAEGPGPARLLHTLLTLCAAGVEHPLIAQADAQADALTEDGTESDPRRMAEFARLARDAGARIIGGGAGLTAAHLGAMREALETTPRDARPTHDEITARLGAPQPIASARRA